MWMIYALVVLNLFDVFGTYISITFLHSFEMNPLMRYIIDHYGFIGLTTFKLASVFFLGYVYKYYAYGIARVKYAIMLLMFVYALLAIYHILNIWTFTYGYIN